LGIIRANAVIEHTTTDLAMIDMARPLLLKHSACSIMSKAQRICTGYEMKAFIQAPRIITEKRESIECSERVKIGEV